MRTYIKDWYNRIIGSLDEDASGNVKAYDFYNRLLGEYIKSLDVTKDFYGRVVARGNTTSALIYAENEKYNSRK